MTVADTILVNGDIRTMGPIMPHASAMAMAGGRIIAVGSDADIRAMAAPHAKVLDAGGRMVLPGFHDTHIHQIEGGHHFVEGTDLSGCKTPQEITARLASYAAETERAWVCGGFYDSARLNDTNLDRRVLDAAVTDRPCFIMASDGHNGCINSKAIELLGLTDDTPDPADGHFVRDAAGHATGLLYERAIDWVNQKRPLPDDEEMFEGVRFAQSLANAHGITGVLDARIFPRLADIYNKMAQEGALTTRTLATAHVVSGEDPAEAVARVTKMRNEATHPMFRVHSAKFFFDGVIENRTAAMIEDYSDEQGGNASLMFGLDEIDTLFTAFDAERFQIHVHAIGDLAVRAALDGMETARKANGEWPSRHHIAHIQFIDPADIPRFAELGVTANIQPLWAQHGPAIDEASLPLVGEARGRFTYAFRSLRDARAEIVLSSDWTVSTLNPFEIMETAITRQHAGGLGNLPPFIPQEALSIGDCVMGYTVNAARAGWRDHETGSLEAGKYADFIVIDRDIFTCPANEIGATKVLATFLGGRAVFGGL